VSGAKIVSADCLLGFSELTITHPFLADPLEDAGGRRLRFREILPDTGHAHLRFPAPLRLGLGLGLVYAPTTKATAN
jgi:hypothetical protein